MIQIRRLGAVAYGATADLEHLRTEFERQHCVRLPAILEPGLLQELRERIGEAEFYERVHEDIGANKELCMRNSTVSGVLHVLFNNAELFDAVRRITGCGSIGCFEGRIYRVTPGCDHYDAWHNDLGGHRMVAMSVNLSEGVFVGGVLQIRERESGKITHEVANTGSGDAILFRLAPELQHRITEVEGTASKTAFAGWFRSQPSFASLLGRQA